MCLYELVTKLSRKEILSIIDVLMDIQQKNGLESLIILMSSVDLDVLFLLRNISSKEISILLHPSARDIILQSRHEEIYKNLLNASPISPLKKFLKEHNPFSFDFNRERSSSPM